MNVLKSRYYNVNRILLLICGLWPYQNTKFRYLQAMLIFGILISFVIYQSILLYVCEYNFKLVLKICSDIFPAILCLLQFIAFLIKPIEVKKLLNQIREEWNALKDSKEIEIAKEYGIFTRRLTEGLLLCAIFSWLFLLLMYLIPNVLNNSAATNESFLTRDEILMQQFEKTYIVKEKLTIVYFLLVFLGVFIMTSTTSMVLAYMHHICVMLKITCYRIEHSLDGNNLHMSISQKNRLMSQKLINAVNIQRRAIQFTKRTVDSFKESYFFLIGIGVISLAINLLHTLQSALIVNNTNELATSSFYVIIHLIYIFIGNYGGQTITDHSADILKQLYHVQWYVAPIQVQKLILFLMLKNSKHFGLVIGGVYVASLEGFITLTSMSVSYFMVIYSTQQ